MRRGAIIGGLAVVALAAAGLVLWQARSAAPGALVLGGNVDIRELDLAFRTGGRIASLAVEEGDRLAPGDEIARLDAAPQRAARAQAQGTLDAATAAETLLKEGARSEEIARLAAEVAGTEAALRNAEASYARQKALKTTSVSLQQALDSTEAALGQAQAAHEAAVQAHLAAVNGPRPAEIAQAAAQRQAAAAARDAAQIQLDDTVLRTPAAGTVLTRAVEPGAMVAAGTTVVTLSLDTPVRVRAYVEEPDLGRVPPGTRVLVFTDARPGAPYHGTVGFVSSRAEFTPKQVETQSLRSALVYRLRITVGDGDAALRQGMPVTVRLAAEAG